MIAYLVMAGTSPVALVNQLVARLRERDPSCRVAVIDAPEHRLARRPECDAYRTRATSGSAWEDERSALAMVAHEFQGARWIGRIHRPDRIPVLPPHLESLDCWICPNGYFLRRSFLNAVVRSEETDPAPGIPIENRIHDLVAAVGGRAGRKPDGGSGDEGYFSTPVLATAMPMRARAFCAVATVEVVEEAEILVRTLRRHHAEPLVLVCDEAVAERVSALGLPRIEIEPITCPLYTLAAAYE